MARLTDSAASVGLVEPRLACCRQPITLQCKATLPGFDLIYETYGELNAAHSNAVLQRQHRAAVHQPRHRRAVGRELSRGNGEGIGEECIVTFPNFGHWRCRTQLALTGRMPVAKHLPHQWYDTPNIHLCTFRDFEQLVNNRGVAIIERFVVDGDYQMQSHVNRFPNLFGTVAFYRLGRAASA